MSALPSAGSITLPASIREAALPDGEREYYARDVYRSGELPLAVVRPRSREQLRTLVVDAANAGLALVTRGGGASYTDAHFARTRAAILIDTGALDRVLVAFDAGEQGAAAILDLNPSTLRSRMQKLNIRKPKSPV